MSLLPRIVPLALVLALVPPPATKAASATADAPHLTGFTAASARAELEREQQLERTFKPDSLRRHLRILTAVPHVAGSPADRATAEYVRDRLAAYGWEARIDGLPSLHFKLAFSPVSFA